MTSSGWDDYVAGGDLDASVSESDVDYAGFDAAAASAVSTELVDGVLADDAAVTRDWADWNTATSADQGYTDAPDHVADPAGIAGDHYGTAADHHDQHTADGDLGGDDPSGDDAS
jgi:hypothetical protein